MILNRARLFANVIKQKTLKHSNLTFAMEAQQAEIHRVCEGSAQITTSGKVFYNPVQEFNRDLSIAVLNAFAKEYKEGDTNWVAGTKYDEGISILEALSATGLRSIRYAKEVKGLKEVVANDISVKAFEDIKRNISDNGVENLVEATHDDATMLMYKFRRERRFDAIDLDPYGCPTIFLDSAVQAVKDGGLLLVTATDMAILAGNTPETCFYKYGSIPLKSKACHEMAVRILLRSIDAHANRYGRYIVPQLSISADFYIRVFVRVFTGPKQCKQSLRKSSMVYVCTGCSSFVLQPLGIVKQEKQVKYSLPTRHLGGNCEHCDQPYHVGGPIWNEPIHSRDFVARVQDDISDSLGTFKRIQGTLRLVSEELTCPLYYTMPQLSGTIHVETPSMLTLRSAILNAGYAVSYSHMHKSSIKTDAPARFIWDVMRKWEQGHPVSKNRNLENTPGGNILKKTMEFDCCFDPHPEANPESKAKGFLRFQQNPTRFWGPGTRGTAMIGDADQKRKRNQGKRKREDTESP